MPEFDFEEQTNDDDLFEGEETEEGRAPLRGWDNPHDVTDGKRIIRDLQYGLVGPKKCITEVAFTIGAKLYDIGVSAKLAEELVFEICKPKEEELVRAELQRVYEVHKHPPGLLSHTPGNDEASWGKRFPPKDDWLEAEDAVWPKPVLYQGKHGAKNGEQFLADRPAPIICSDGILYSFEQRIWRHIPEIALAAEIRATDPALFLDTGNINSMIGAIRIACHTTARVYNWIDKPENAPAELDLILFGNGILDVATGNLLPHDGSYFATGLPDFDYDSKATCPRFDQFLNEVLHPSFHDAFFEFAGYVMTADNSLEKIFLFIGTGRGGKSTLARIVQKLCGRDHAVSRSLSDLGGEFGLEGTLDTRLFTIPDAHDADTSKRGVALNRLKAVSGNDAVGINRKNLTIITALLVMRFLIVCNRNPKFLDDSGALAAREIPFVFENSFRGREDHDLASKLEAELPGIANRALEGLRRLRKNGGKFTICAKARAAIREIAESQSPALRFAKEHLSVTGDLGDYASLADVFDVYKDWAFHHEGLGRGEKRNRDDFKNDLVAALTIHGVRYGRRRWHDPTKLKRGKGELKRGFFGIKLKNVGVPE